MSVIYHVQSGCVLLKLPSPCMRCELLTVSSLFPRWGFLSGQRTKSPCTLQCVFWVMNYITDGYFIYPEGNWYDCTVTETLQCWPVSSHNAFHGKPDWTWKVNRHLPWLLTSNRCHWLHLIWRSLAVPHFNPLQHAIHIRTCIWSEPNRLKWTQICWRLLVSFLCISVWSWHGPQIRSGVLIQSPLRFWTLSQ